MAWPHSLSAALTSIGRHSLAWRFARDEGHIVVALQKPLLGSGQWNWWQAGDSRPWSLWLLVFGMYGLVGLIAFGTILLLPVLRAVWPPEGANAPQRAKYSAGNGRTHSDGGHRQPAQWSNDSSLSSVHGRPGDRLVRQEITPTTTTYRQHLKA